jgi:hypothetical protein
MEERIEEFVERYAMEYIANKDNYNMIRELSERANSEYRELVCGLSSAEKAECLLTLLKCMKVLSVEKKRVNMISVEVGLN